MVNAVRGPTAEDWDRASDVLAAAIESAKRQLAAAVGEARARTLAADGARVTTVLVREPRPDRRAKPAAAGSASASAAEAAEAAEAETAQAVAKLGTVLARLPADAPASLVDRSHALGRAYLSSASPAERANVLDAIRHLVQGEQDRQVRIARNAAVIEALYRELDGLDGERVATLRGRLKGQDLAAALTDGLREEVAAAKAAAEAEQDRQFVLEAAAKALGELGYAVGDDFRTAVPSAGAVLDLPHSARHGLRIRERGRRLELNVVRFDHEGRRDPFADHDAEEAFCRDFAKVKDRMREDGVDLSMLRADAPGQTPMQVLAAPPAQRRDRDEGAQGEREL